jgi:hypothetical protein
MVSGFSFQEWKTAGLLLAFSCDKCDVSYAERQRLVTPAHSLVTPTNPSQSGALLSHASDVFPAISNGRFLW